VSIGVQILDEATANFDNSYWALRELLWTAEAPR